MKVKIPTYNLTNKQREEIIAELRPEIEKQGRIAYLEAQKAYCKDFDATLLWLLHTEFGFGEQRLRKVFDKFRETLKELEEYYEMPDEGGWLCYRMLKQELGIDLNEWEKEV